MRELYGKKGSPYRNVTFGENRSPKSEVVDIFWPLFSITTVDQEDKEGLIVLVG